MNIQSLQKQNTNSLCEQPKTYMETGVKKQTSQILGFFSYLASQRRNLLPELEAGQQQSQPCFRGMIFRPFPEGTPPQQPRVPLSMVLNWRI